MIRPIDTQILYPQTPELANRQQQHNDKPNIHQDAFANTMKQELEHKKATVQEVGKDEKIDNDLNKKGGKRQESQHHNKKKQQQDEEVAIQDCLETRNKIDIRI